MQTCFRVFFAAAVAAGLAALVSASTSNHVQTLTSSTYPEAINDGKVYFVKYYAPWCGHCKRLAPTWEELAESLKGEEDIKIATVDCTEEKSICSDAQIKGYPTLKVMYSGSEYKAYRGPREVAALKEFITNARDELTKETEE